MSPHQELKLLSSRLVAGHTEAGNLCPYCRGGKTGEKSLSLHLRDDGLILFICHRASCGKHGRIHRNGNVISSEQAGIQKGWEPRRYTGDRRALNRAEQELLSDLYGLSISDIKKHRLSIDVESHRLVTPIQGIRGNLRGYELRYLEDRPPGAPKTSSYKEVEEQWLGWFASEDFKVNDPIVIVEDCLSAMKVCHRYVSVSLLGSHVSIDDLYEVCKLSDNIILALDKDATDKALKFQQRYKFICPTLKVMILEKDLKYCTDGEIQEKVEACR